MPRGAKANYGLLGAELLRDGRSEGDVSVAINCIGFPMQDTLAVMPDDVRIGLLDEYADAVVAGVERVVTDGWRFTGELAFRWAAHAAVGSSPRHFEELAVIVATLLARTTIPSEDELLAILNGS